MKSLLVALGLLTGCAAPEATEPVAGAPADCALWVGFGSYAMGIDRGTLERVEALLAADRGVLDVERLPWGREGEVTLCVRLRRESEARPLFERITAMLPADPRGPISVSTRGGLRFDAPKRP